MPSGSASGPWRRILGAVGDDGGERQESAEGAGQEAPLSALPKLRLFLRYILDSWRKLAEK